MWSPTRVYCKEAAREYQRKRTAAVNADLKTRLCLEEEDD